MVSYSGPLTSSCDVLSSFVCTCFLRVLHPVTYIFFIHTRKREGERRYQKGPKGGVRHFSYNSDI